MAMKRLIICSAFFISFISHGVFSSILCETGFCRNYLAENDCPNTSNNCNINNATHYGLLLPSPTICNCCPYCLPLIGENQPCPAGGPGLGTTVGRCDDSLSCTAERSDYTCTRMETDCHKAQDDFDNRFAAGTLGALEWRPHCDGKGKFAPFHCVPSQTCFCQSEDGERIFGEFLYQGTETAKTERCGCSRYHEKINKIIAPGVPYPIEAMRCTSDGNFNPIQCVDKTCFCVDPITGVMRGDERVDLDEDPITKLPCYDINLDLFPEQSEGDPPYEYTTPCFAEVKETIEFIRQSEEDGYIMDYFTSVSGCSPDGTFARIEITRNGSKICVDERGEQMENFEAEPKTEEFENMDCKCAQTRHIMAGSDERPICCKNGNYRKIQCRRGFCRCVDNDGRQVGVESSNVQSLSCYTANWRDC